MDTAVNYTEPRFWATRLLISVALFTVVANAKGAAIEVSSVTSGEEGLVSVTGPFESGDFGQFRTKTSLLSKAVVMFSSDGGDLEAGIQIGRLIRMKGFLSLVSDGARCASACALAWLGGSKRLMEPTAQVGFHAAYVVENGVATATSAGNALVGAYLNQIGLPDRAVIYITDPAPQEIRWLNLPDAQRLGIEVSLFTPDTKKTATGPQTPPPGLPEAWPTPSPATEETDAARCNVPPGWQIPARCSGLY